LTNASPATSMQNVHDVNSACFLYETTEKVFTKIVGIYANICRSKMITVHIGPMVRPHFHIAHIEVMPTNDLFRPHDFICL